MKTKTDRQKLLDLIDFLYEKLPDFPINDWVRIKNVSIYKGDSCSLYVSFKTGENETTITSFDLTLATQHRSFADFNLNKFIEQAKKEILEYAKTWNKESKKRAETEIQELETQLEQKKKLLTKKQ